MNDVIMSDADCTPGREPRIVATSTPKIPKLDLTTDAEYVANLEDIRCHRVNRATGVTKPQGCAIQHIPVPVPSHDKLGGLRQEGHPA